uniref:NACHT and WD repeat domain containing 1 n=1 Tax=Monopterus albus TaxID=43700 RepID=A0A3Q3KHV7_MONAL
MSSERKALLEKAYPEVLSFCRSLGLVFEVVDLRWGIRNVPSGDHESCEIFLWEIERCKKISAGPAFVALLGNRYGHRALPRLVPEKQFEVLLSKLSKNPEGTNQLNQWFLKDDNADPPTYILQPVTAHFPHYGDLQPENRPQHDNNVSLWRSTETQLLQLLRSAATDAEATPRQKVKDGPKRFAKYMDVATNGLLDAEAQGLLAGLKSRLYATSQKILNLHSVELTKGSIDPKRKEHAQYLDGICEQFVSQMKSRIEARMVEEVGWHIAMSEELCRGLHGREGLLGKLCLAMWESTNINHKPLVVHGAAGIGKTAVLCKLAQEMRGVLDTGSVVAIRLLSARHPQRLDVDYVLYSICLQICLACGLSPPSPLTANTHLELLRFFRNILAEVSQQGNTLLIILDALDQLSDQHHAHKLRWLPADVPPNIHLVVSMDTNSEAFANIRLKLETLESFFEVERLSREEGKHIMESSLRVSQRMLTPEQSNTVLQSFEATGCPLHLRLILSAAKRWTSFTPPTEIHLGASTQEVMSQLFLMLEEKHGKELVGSALSYIALAREGLLEAELRDVLSLDDDVIREVYKFSLPPTPSLIRLPPLLWARLRWDMKDQLEERWVGGIAAITFSSRHLVEAVSTRYLTTARRGRSLKILAEYFMGRWSGKLKPVALPSLSLLLSDRKVPPQPLWFAPGLANIRKLQELPYHLLHAGLWEELRQEIIGSAEWLYCKSRVCGVSSVIHDLDQCSQYMDCTETTLIRDALVLIKPSLDFLHDMSLFYTELLARLSSLATAFPSVIGQLCSQCSEWLLTCPEPILIPKCSFLQQPGGALQHTLSGLQGGVLCMDISVEAGLLVAGSDDGGVAVWSLRDQQLIHTLLGHTGQSEVIKCESSNSLDRFLDLHHDDDVLSACISSDCRVLASGTADHLIQVRGRQSSRARATCRTVQGEREDTLQEGGDTKLVTGNEVCCLELAQHKRLLLCGLISGTVLIYPLAMTQETLCIPPPESLSRVLCLAVTSKERHVAVAYEDSVRLFEITNRDNFPTVEGPLQSFPLSLLHGQISSMALLCDRRLLYGTSCGEVKLYDFSSDSSSDLESHRSRVTCVTASNCGSHALVGSEDAVQRLWALSPLGFFFEGVLSAAFSDTGQFVFTGSQDRTVKVWDVATGNLLYVQYVYSPVIRMLTFKNGFVALSQQGYIIKEVFRCPDHISPDYNPLRNVKAQYRVTSREKSQGGQQSPVSVYCLISMDTKTNKTNQRLAPSLDDF